MLAVAPAAERPPSEREPDAVAARPVAIRARLRALAAAAVLPGRVLAVVAQPEEPDQPHHEQADVENPEADHEDPPLGGHEPMLARLRGGGKPLPHASLLCLPYSSAGVVGRGSGTYVAV